MALTWQGPNARDILVLPVIPNTVTTLWVKITSFDGIDDHLRSRSFLHLLTLHETSLSRWASRDSLVASASF